MSTPRSHLAPVAARLLALIAVIASGACGRPDLEVLSEPDAADRHALDGSSLDAPETVDVGSWNIEWLGAPDRGPSDEALQLENAANVLRNIDLDVIGLVEVVSAQSFAALLEQLPGFHGVLVTDGQVEGDVETYGADEQKVALVMKDRFEVTAARVVLQDAQWDFAGRPPMEVSLQFEEGGKRRTLDVVVAHFKAMANADGYARRTRAASALKTWLADEHRYDWVLVVGDFNDDLDASTYGGRESPFSTFIDDPGYAFTTTALTEANESTTVHFSATIDHHLATASLARRFVDDSAAVIRPDAWLPDFGDTTSDHFPVLTRYDLR